MKETKPREIRFYEMENGQKPAQEWIDSLGSEAQRMVLARITRVSLGLLGDHKTIGDGLYELRIFHGPGLRVYFAQADGQIILLLCGGDKSSQRSDIKFAKKYWKDWKETR
jgi:putative addiction module killer protein